MGNLFSVFDLPSSLAEEEKSTERYRPSYAFDMSAGEFVLDGGGKMQYASGYDAWVLWCVKTIKTQRWAHLAYRWNIGTELAEAFALEDRAAQESFLERTVTEALLADPKGRTVRVYDFEFLWEGDSLSLTCTIFGQKGDTASVTVKV
ncbi:MAG: DUF2634 domain-containing protein [Eubacteriales bacterium]